MFVVVPSVLSPLPPAGAASSPTFIFDIASVPPVAEPVPVLPLPIETVLPLKSATLPFSCAVNVNFDPFDVISYVVPSIVIVLPLKSSANLSASLDIPPTPAPLLSTSTPSIVSLNVSF